MNVYFNAFAVAAVVALGVGGGYLWGSRSAPTTGHVDSTSTSPTGTELKRKVLYYRNPMGLPDTSPVPKKDPMGMDYIAVYEGEEEQSGGTQIKISTEKVQRLGVKTEPAAMREIAHTIRTIGTIQVDERRISTVAPKFEGWIEQLHVGTTGQPVAHGQPLMEIFSPDLITAQQEYLIAVRGMDAVKDGSADIQASMRQLRASALTRLRNWDISEQELQRLEGEGAMRRTVTLRSPVSGVVVEKPALKGMRFMPGEALYRISDLSSLWVLADVFEQDLALVRPGQAAIVTVNAYPERTFKGKVSFFYPTLTPETRTGKVRIELVNPGGLLKPGMYAMVELAAGPSRKLLAVPRSAVIDSGIRRIVLVQTGEGRFEPREVKVGTLADDNVEILDGVKEGEAVVVAANFLIDAESNLRAALSSFQAAPANGAEPRPDAKAAGASHRAEGTIESFDPKTGALSITHGPVPSLEWPAMTMAFNLANSSLAARAKPGEKIAFEFVERKPGEYVVTRIEPVAPGKPAAGRSEH